MRRDLLASAVVALVIGMAIALPSPSSLAAVGGCGGKPDFDNDGRADTAVGVPGEEFVAFDDAGAVHVIYGSGTGLSSSGDQLLHLDSPDMAGEPADFDHFGDITAAGDFDGDGFSDLAVGIPDKDLPENSSAGAIEVIYGSPAGLTAVGSQFIHQDTSGMTDSAQQGDRFGTGLASGDFDNDGRCDLAVGVPGQSEPLPEGAGAVHIIYGSSSGLTASGDQVLHRAVSGVADDPGEFDAFGETLASGDFNADGRDDLAVGVPFDNITGSDEGSLHVFYGSASGITTAGNAVFHQNTTGMTDEAESDDNFGRAAAAGDFDSDGRDDLGIGVPFEAPGDAPNGGAVHVMYGGSGGLSASGDQLIHQDASGMADSAEDGPDVGPALFASRDRFGDALASGDFDNDGRDDLGVGVPGEDIEGADPESTKWDAGAVHIVYGSSTGLTASGDQFIHQDTSGIADTAEGVLVGCGPDCGFAVGDSFGGAVSSGDFDADGRDDLGVGINFEDIGENPFDDHGAIHIIYGSSTGLTASGDQFLHQDTSGFADGADEGDSFGSSLPGSHSNNELQL